MTITDTRPALPHDALLTLARKIEAAAPDGDRVRLEHAARRLLDELVHHVTAERGALLHVPPAEHRLLARGQQRIVDLIVDLARATTTPEPCACDDVADLVYSLLTLQADDERRTFGRAYRLERSSTMSVTEPLRHEHADLYPHLDELDVVAARLGDWNGERAHQLAAVVAFLREHLVPHARAEEAALYPMVEQVMSAPGATDTMQADHVEIVRRIDQLAATIATVGNGPPAAPQTEELRGQLYGLSAILRLHFAKEEEVLLPVLDAHLSPADAAQLFAKMGAVAHPHEGPTT